MLDHQLDAISQFVFSTQTYEQGRCNFREKKNKIFSVEEKSRFRRASDEESPHTSPKQRILPQKTNFILRLNSTLQMQQVSSDTTRNFSNIIVLDASSARLSYLPDAVLSQMPCLQLLNLQNNLLSELPLWVYKMPLVQLNINNNLLKTFKCELPWQQSLERLDVGKNHVRQIPNGLWKCMKLSTLDIRSNDFDTLSGDILNLERQLCALGIDWVKYSLKEYHPDRNDILSEDQLALFWKVLKSIITPSSTNYQFVEESLDDEFVVTCWDFLDRYDQCILQLEKHTNLPDIDDIGSYMSERRPNDQHEHYLLRNDSQDNGFAAPTHHQEDPPEQSYQTDECMAIEPPKRKIIQRFIMHQTVKEEDLGVLRSLLRYNVTLAEQVDEQNHTPLSLAIHEEKYHCAKILLNANININIGGGPMGSCLNLAISKGQYFLLRDLISAKAKVNATDPQGNGPLHYLIPVFRRSTVEAVKMAYLLMDAGSDPNLKNRKGQTPLLLAVSKQVVNAVKFAIQHNFDMGSPIFDFKVRSKKDCSTLLHIACKSESIKNILQISFIQPYNLFEYNKTAQRPYDIIHKNYTLSKLIQTIEQTYITQVFRIKEKKQQSVAHLPISQYNSFQIAEEDDGEVGIHLGQGMALMKMSPKLKKAGTFNSRVQKITDGSSEPYFKRHKPKDKVPKENIDVGCIKKMVQQRNNLAKVEQFNQSYMKTSSLSQEFGITRGVTHLVNKLINLQEMATNSSSFLEALVILKTKEQLMQELNIAKQNEMFTLKIQDALNSLGVQFDDKFLLPFDHLQFQFQLADESVLEPLEKELLSVNQFLQLEQPTLNCQYEKYQTK